MKQVSMVTALVLAASLAARPGCGTKKEQPQTQAQKQAAPQQPGQAPHSQGELKASPQDEAEVAPLKEKVLAHVKAGEYEAIYREASDGFRAVGPKEQFVAMWQKQVQETGPFKEATQIGHSVRPTDRFLVYIYQVRYEKKPKELKLTFGRSSKGKYELTGINQTEKK
jgi:hypothetical protein